MKSAVCGLLIAFLAASPLSAQLEPASVVANVEGITVAVGEAPFPRLGQGAPAFSPEQTASLFCAVQDARGKEARDMRIAHEATVRAREVRIAAFNGEATEAQMVEAELARQAAITGLYGRAVGWNGRREDQVLQAPVPGLVIERVTTRRILENARPVLVIDGAARSTGAARIELPPITLHAVDAQGFVLAGQTSPLSKASLEPGERVAFTFRFKNPPAYTVKVSATFAPPFEARNFRGCDFFDPLVFDPNAAALGRTRARAPEAPPVPVPDIGAGAPRYTTQELSVLIRKVRSDAQTAFAASIVGSQQRRRPQVCPAAQRPAWRDLLILGDLLDDAWVATNAAEEARRDAAKGVFLPEDVAAAELARQEAVRAFMSYRARMPAAPPVSRPGFSIENAVAGTLDSVSFTISPGGLDFDRGRLSSAQGEVVNLGAARADMPPLRVKAYDRFGFVVAEFIDDDHEKIRGGGRKAFNLHAGVPSGTVQRVEVGFGC